MNGAVPKLNYGIARRRSLRRRLWGVITVLVLLALVSTVVIYAPAILQKVYWYPSTSVRNYLESLTQVRDVQINAYDNPPGLTVLYASVTLEGAGNRTFRLALPNRTELRRGSHIRLDSIGEFDLGVRERDGTARWWIDIGSTGSCADLLPFTVHNVQDIVRRYDEILAFIETISPSYIHRSTDGTDCKVDAAKMDSKRGTPKRVTTD